MPRVKKMDIPTRERVSPYVCQRIGARAGLSQIAVEVLSKQGHDRLKEDLGIPSPNLGGLVNDLSAISEDVFGGRSIMPSEFKKAKTVTACIDLTLKAALKG